MQSHDLSKSDDSSFRISDRIPENFGLSFSPSSNSKIPKIEFIMEDEPIMSPMEENQNNLHCSPKSSRTPKNFQDKKKINLSFKKSLRKLKRKNKNSLRGDMDVFQSMFIVSRIAKAYAKKIYNFIKKRNLYKSVENFKNYHYHIISDPVVFHEADEVKQSRISRLNRKEVQSDINVTKIRENFTKELVKAKVLKTCEILDRVLPTFNPLAPWKIGWDILMMLINFSAVFIYSLEKAFVTEFEINWLGLILMIALYIDIIINVNTKIFDGGVQVTERKKILTYFVRHRIFTEGLPCLGISIINFSGHAGFFYDLNILLLLKIPRLTETTEKVKEWLVQNEKAESLFNLIILLSKIFIWGHVIACLWHYLAYLSIYYNDGNNWLKIKGIQNESWSTKYLHAIYWSFTTMLTVGYGDITPTNRKEMFFNTIAMFLGCVMFGYSMSRIAEIVKMFDATDRQLKAQMKKVIALMRGKNIPLETQTKVRKYLEFVWKQELKEDPEHEKQIMSKLSSNLRDEIALYTNAKFLKTVKAFSSFSDKTLVKLAGLMKKVRYSPEEYIYREGDYEDICLYFVIDGNLEQVQECQSYKNQRNVKWKTYKKDDYFGVHEIFTGMARPLAVISADFSTLFQLNRNDLIKVLQKNPEDYEKFCKIRDHDLILQEQEQYKIDCTACSFIDHRTHNCNFFKYSPNKFLIIARYKDRKLKSRKNFKRKGVYSKNSLLEKENIAEALNDFLSTYQNDEELNKLRNLYVLQTSEKEIRLESDNYFEKILTEEISDEDHEPLSLAFLESIQKPTKKHSTILKKREKTLVSQGDFHTNTQSGKSEKAIFTSIDLHKTKSITNSKPPAAVYAPKGDELSFDKIKSFKYYYPHNNIDNVLNRINTKYFLSLKDKVVQFMKH